MNQAELQSKILEYYQKLPKEVQVIFSGMTWLDVLKELGTKYNLNPNQLESLTTETTLVLLGIVDINEYYETLRKEIQLEGTKYQEFNAEIDGKILGEISSSLYKTFSNNAFELEKKDEAENYKKKLYEIGNKYKLPIDAIGEIENTTDRFLKGELSSMQYENSLSIITDLTSDKLSSFIKEINTEIIDLRREQLVEMQSKDSEETEDIPLPPSNYTKTENSVEKEKVQEEVTIPLPPMDYNKVEQAQEQVTKPKIEVKTIGIQETPSIKVEAKKQSQDLIDEILKGSASSKVSEAPKQNENDLYKEHGIEIIGDEQVSLPAKGEMPGEQRGSSEEMNILAQKLSSNTASKTVVSDYSLPKINLKMTPISNLKQELPSKPHDAYHEEI